MYIIIKETDMNIYPSAWKEMGTFTFCMESDRLEHVHFCLEGDGGGGGGGGNLHVYRERNRNIYMETDREKRLHVCTERDRNIYMFIGKKQFHLYMERDRNIYTERGRGTLHEKKTGTFTGLHRKRQEHVHVYRERDRQEHLDGKRRRETCACDHKMR